MSFTEVYELDLAGGRVRVRGAVAADDSARRRPADWAAAPRARGGSPGSLYRAALGMGAFHAASGLADGGA